MSQSFRAASFSQRVRRRVVLGGATLAVFVGASTARAQTSPLNIYVFNTGNDTLTSAQVQDWVRERAGTTNVTITVLNAAMPQANFLPDGTPLAFYTASGDTARVRVRGNLVGTNNMRFYGIGSRLLSIDVAGNANLAKNFTIDVSARGRIGGAGGGTGGEGAKAVAYEERLVSGEVVASSGGAGGLGNRTPSEGRAGVYPTYHYVDGNNITVVNGPLYGLITRPVRGTSGTAGANDYQTAAGSNGSESGIPIYNVQPTGLGGAAGANAFNSAFNTAGSDGKDGSNGFEGKDGFSGGSARNTDAWPPDGPIQLRAGSGGGGGQAGGHGIGGERGGGGGGGGAVAHPGAPSVDAGGGGGNGGSRGHGGMGGDGGNGGGGGGGVELYVAGRLITDGTMLARGGAGITGGAGGAGTLGGAGQAGSPGKDAGKRGGNGGAGGDGGNGGRGGDGGGGSGGNIHVISSTLYSANSVYGLPSNAVYSAQGGSGGGANGNVHFLNFGGQPGRNTVPLNRIPGRQTPFISANSGDWGDYPMFTPNSSETAYGADAMGLMADEFGRPSSNTAGYYQTTKGDVHGNLPDNVIGYVKSGLPRSQFVIGTETFDRHRHLTFTAVRGTVNEPKWMAINGEDVRAASFGLEGYAYVPDGPKAFLQGGYLTDPNWTSGATGPTVINSISSGQTYLTTIRNGKGYDYTFTYNPYGTLRKFTFSEADIAEGAAVTDIGRLRLRGTIKNGDGSGATTTLYDLTNDNVNQSTTQNVLIRAGTTKTLTFTAENTGNAYTRLTGTAAYNVDQVAYSGIEPGRQEIIGNVTIDASDRTPGQVFSQVSRAEFANHFDNQGAKSVVVTTGMTVVGPIFKVATGDVVEFDAYGTKLFEQDNVVVQNLGLNNNLPDNGSLAYLNINGVTISGPDAAAFKLADGKTDVRFSVPGANPGSSPFFGLVPVVFTPDHIGEFNATITLHTDVGTYLKGDGTDYVIRLHGVSSVPEPGAAVLIGLCGTIAVAGRRRRATV